MGHSDLTHSHCEVTSLSLHLTNEAYVFNCTIPVSFKCLAFETHSPDSRFTNTGGTIIDTSDNLYQCEFVHNRYHWD
jgi:hypothetical protein